MKKVSLNIVLLKNSAEVVILVSLITLSIIVYLHNKLSKLKKKQKNSNSPLKKRLCGAVRGKIISKNAKADKRKKKHSKKIQEITAFNKQVVRKEEISENTKVKSSEPGVTFAVSFSYPREIRNQTLEKTTINENSIEGRLKRFKQLGEFEKCPYCKKHLEKIPKRKSKCPFCKENIYVRTRPLDRKKVLVTEEQKKEIEKEWEQHYILRWDDPEIIETPEFLLVEKELRKVLGRTPYIIEIKKELYERQLKKQFSKKEWGLYRNTKYGQSRLLKAEDNLQASLLKLFEVVYLDINGANNSGKFVKEMAFIAPGTIVEINSLIKELGYSKEMAKKLFISTNVKNKPVKMPISEKDAWEILRNELELEESTNQKMNSIDYTQIDQVIKHLMNSLNEKKLFQRIVYDFRDHYRTKKIISQNAEKIEKFIKTLLSFRETYEMGMSTLVFFAKKDKSRFSHTVIEILKENKEHYEKCPLETTIGDLGKIEINWVKPFIPKLINTMINHTDLEIRKFATYNLGEICTKHPQYAKAVLPEIIEYIKNPTIGYLEHPFKDPFKSEFENDLFKIKIVTNIDFKEQLKQTYLHFLNNVIIGDKTLIVPYKKTLIQIKLNEKNDYSKKLLETIIGKL